MYPPFLGYFEANPAIITIASVNSFFSADIMTIICFIRPTEMLTQSIGCVCLEFRRDRKCLQAHGIWNNVQGKGIPQITLVRYLLCYRRSLESFTSYLPTFGNTL